MVPSRHHLADRIGQGRAAMAPRPWAMASMRLVSRVRRSGKAGARLLPCDIERSRALDSRITAGCASPPLQREKPPFSAQASLKRASLRARRASAPMAPSEFPAGADRPAPSFLRHERR
jgi:hypothetical protein